MQVTVIEGKRDWYCEGFHARKVKVGVATIYAIWHMNHPQGATLHTPRKINGTNYELARPMYLFFEVEGKGELACLNHRLGAKTKPLGPPTIDTSHI